MGLFQKLKEYNDEHKKNALYQLIHKKLVADGEEHIVIKDTLKMSDKTFAEFEEAMKANGFELIDLDVMPSSLGTGFQSIKVKYRSKN